MTDDCTLQWKKDKHGVWSLYDGNTKLALIENLPNGTFQPLIFNSDEASPIFDYLECAIQHVDKYWSG